VRSYEVTPEVLGVAPAPLAAILGGDAAENAAVTREILSGRLQDARRDVVALSAGAALYLAGRAPDLPSGVTQALELLAAGAGLEVLERYAAFTRGG
jgi:anthranilate phosphoribosyltransferase